MFVAKGSAKNSCNGYGDRNSKLTLFLPILQALKVEMVEFMVRLLETGTEALENPAATKAQIVKAIKAMQNSLTHGEQVTQGFTHQKKTCMCRGT